MLNKRVPPNSDLENLISQIEANWTKPSPVFNKDQHNADSRLSITKLFLKWYFCLIGGAFLFTGLYNFIAAHLNHMWASGIPFIEVTNTVSIITTTLSSGVGFVIGYYFKNKEEN